MSRFFKSKRGSGKDKKQDAVAGTKEIIELSGTQQGLGFNIIGGKSASGMNFGIFVSKITENGAVARDGRLKCGDQLLKANKHTLHDVTRQQAIDILKSCAAQKTVCLVVLRDSQSQEDYRRLAAAFNAAPRVQPPDSAATGTSSTPLGDHTHTDRQHSHEIAKVNNVHIRESDGRYMYIWSVPQMREQTREATTFAGESLATNCSSSQNLNELENVMPNQKLFSPQSDGSSLGSNSAKTMHTEQANHVLSEPVGMPADDEYRTTEHVSSQVESIYENIRMSPSSVSSYSTNRSLTSTDISCGYSDRHIYGREGDRSHKGKSVVTTSEKMCASMHMADDRADDEGEADIYQNLRSSNTSTTGYINMADRTQNDSPRYLNSHLSCVERELPETQLVYQDQHEYVPMLPVTTHSGTTSQSLNTDGGYVSMSSDLQSSCVATSSSTAPDGCDPLSSNTDDGYIPMASAKLVSSTKQDGLHKQTQYQIKTSTSV